MIYPVILQGSIPSLAANQVRGLLDERALQNPTDSLLRVRELRFDVLDALDPNTATETNFASLDVQLRIGNEPITAGFVPLSAMVWPADISDFNESFAPHQPFLIRFVKPILLLPGQRITMQCRNTDRSGAHTALRILVYAVCEPVASLRGFMPWFTFYQTPVHAFASGVYEDVSTEADLVNPFRDEMEIERFISRTFIDYKLAPANYSTLFNLVRVRIDDHNAVQNVRDATPVGALFDVLFRSWVVNTRLVAKGYFRASVESRLITAGSPVDVYTVIGMFGYREVK